MCGRFTLRARLNSLLDAFSAGYTGTIEEGLQFNICPTNKVFVIRQGETGREMSKLQWSLIPSWAKDLKFCPINAVSETIADKAMFKSAIRKRRCLIAADGFYEWKKVDGKAVKGEAPWLFEVGKGEPFAFAGIWERWDKGEAPLETCAILTTTPNELMAPIHNRLPVILSPSDYDAWLDPTMNDPAKLTYLYEPFPASDMRKIRVSNYVNKVANKGPECVAPVE
jgi:putative SOS response-associated peptidase YedK